MASLADLIRQHTDLSSDQQRHLSRMLVLWGMLADLCFADLLLFLPVERATDQERFVIGGQVRPTTAQTLYREDQVGRFVTVEQRPLVRRALMTEAIVTDQVDLELAAERVLVTAIPVTFEGEVIAVLTSETPQRTVRERGDLERAYLSVFDRFSRMIADGTFPYDTDDRVEQAPRVGDGAIIVDARSKVTFTSPNAVSALHRMGFHMNAIGRTVEDLGVPGDVVRTASSLRVPVTKELERGLATTILVRVLPLVTPDSNSGALVLLRDVSDLRQQERLLVSMDATIREIHHRVKNNLQTVSSLLRLQGRRVEVPEAKSAIDESVRRIRSIALVHEILAREGGDDVDLVEVLRPVIDMVEQALVSPDRPVRFRIIGDGPALPASTASSLAVVATELLQNAVEHGFPPGSEGGQVVVELEVLPRGVAVRVHDDGAGLPEGFDLATSPGLGLTIARTLATGDLGGTLTLRPGPGGERPGSIAELRVEFTDD